MAGGTGKKNGTRTKRPRLKYFFVNGKLHKKLLINRGADTIVAWNYPDAKRVTYTYSDVLRRMQTAFTTTQVGAMMHRHPRHIKRYVRDGSIDTPQYTYRIDDPTREIFQYMWREENILDLHAYMTTLHRGAPRKDGLTANTDLPNVRELRAIIHDEAVLYVKQGDQFVPTWRARDL